jgi:hypothetical protein
LKHLSKAFEGNQNGNNTKPKSEEHKEKIRQTLLKVKFEMTKNEMYSKSEPLRITVICIPFCSENLDGDS